MKTSRRLLSQMAQIPFICHRCKTAPLRLPRPRQSYSTTTTNPIPPPSGRVLLKSRRLIQLSGPDSSHYLQGAITSNIAPSSTPRTTGFFSAFLDAQGRVLNDVFIYPLLQNSSIFGNNGKYGDGEGWLIEVDTDEAEKLVKHIKKYKLRAKFEVRLLDEGEAGVWSIWQEGGGKEVEWTAHGFTSQDSPSITPPPSNNPSPISCLDTRAPGLGKRLIIPGSQSLDSLSNPELSIPETTEENYKIRRYLNGIAEGQKEILRETALVQQSNLDWMGAVDYRKGCYVGQELTIRTFHTGVVRKRILPLMIYGDGEAVPDVLEYREDSRGKAEGVKEGTAIKRVDRKGRRAAGKWLAGVGNVGLGLVRLEVMTKVVVQGEVGGYKEGDEFMLDSGADESGNQVKVKAFIPAWHLSR